MPRKTFRFLPAVMAAALLSTISGVVADPDLYVTSLNFGITMTEGNSESMLGNISLQTQSDKDRHVSMRAGIDAAYGETVVRRVDADGDTERVRETTTENARLYANVRKTLSESTFTYVDGLAAYDEIAEIDYRAILGPGLGAYIFKRDRSSLSVEVGASYIWEEVSDQRDDYLAARLAQRFEHAFSETARLWQASEILPKADRFDDYLLNAELGIEAALNSRMSLRLVLQDMYDATPGEGLKKNDLTLIAGMRVQL